jgi:spoIIIJ-associated protein
MKSIIKEGKSTQSIISEFMKEYNLTLDDFKFNVIEKGSNGFLNLFGSKPTKIEFIIPETKDIVHKIIEDFLSYVPIKYDIIKVEEKSNGTFYINIIGVDDAGFLIGKAAQFIDSMQLLISQMLNKQLKKTYHITLDVDGYRQKRKDALISKVKAIVDAVKKKEKSITMEPMNAANRRIVHKYLEKEKDIKSITVGDGAFKRIVLMPSKKVRKEKRSRKTEINNRK